MPVYGFGPFVLDVRERRLTRDGRTLPVAGKSFEVLRLLAEAGGRLVSRDAFYAELWPASPVEDRNLTVRISALRKIMDGDGGASSTIETVTNGGYRLGPAVRLMAPAPLPQPSSAASDASFVKAEARVNLNKMERLPALRALGLFERALAADAGDADCHAGLASTYLLLASTTIRRPLPVDEAVRLARDSARRALVLDDSNGEARAVLGRLAMAYEWDWQTAEAELRRAVALAPRSADAALGLGLLLSATGRHDEAVESLATARQLDPLRRDTLEHLGLGCWMAGAAERGLSVLADAAAIDPEARRPHFRRMIVLDQLGRREEAMAERTAWLELFDHAPFAAHLARLVRDAGYRAAMVEWIGLLEQHNQWYEVAIQRMVIDDIDGAIDALERAVALHTDSAVFLAQYPSFRPLLGEPRYERLVARLGLAAFRPRA